MRTATSPLVATFQIALIGLGVPIATFLRLNDSLHPLQNADAALILGIAIWLVLAKAVITSGDAVDSSKVNLLSPMWQAQRMVERSLVGVGYSAHQAKGTTQDLRRLAAPQIITPDQLPQGLVISLDSVPRQTRSHVDLDDDHVLAIPVIGDSEPELTTAYETQEYVVARGDTFWSISEVVLGDGRLWKTLLEINFGREVAPGVLLDEDAELRIGWSILLPLIEQEDDADHEDAEVQDGGRFGPVSVAARGILVAENN